MCQFYETDRCEFIFAPNVGPHEYVYGLDLLLLYLDSFARRM